MARATHLIASQRFLLLLLQETSPSAYAMIAPLLEQGYTVNGRTLRNA